jgi:hypothetical protein
MRWLTIGLCLPLLLIGFMGLFAPHQTQTALLRLSSRLSDQSSIAPFVRFLKARHFVLFLRLYSLVPIGMGVALLWTIK